ncbi:hypothetical protein UFOVP399_12 [uncultured Caudovirales phage]|uniref:Uncharacterized protein n=1 Tax=uncultured Caudovirales phage TaxID=2100421 RepID=A0A6J5M3V2_9CAUD|nr:hypothetical protein UFOVP399_12 [uncultured Caudovirales phage]
MSETYDKIKHWYGWNGGDRPVHAKTIVDTVDVDGGTWRGEACGADWSHDNRTNDIAAFRITKLYVDPPKPREWWIADFGTDSQSWLAYGSREAVNEGALVGSAKIVHVREVLPEDEA